MTDKTMARSCPDLMETLRHYTWALWVVPEAVLATSAFVAVVELVRCLTALGGVL